MIFLIKVIFSSVLILFSFSGLAQDETSGYMEEIIVTTKRGDSVNLQSMSEAITSFSGDGLAREAAVTLEDFNHAIPNVQLEHVGLFQAAASFSMRGIGTAGIESFADPVVAVFVDDVYYSRNAVALLDLFDVTPDLRTLEQETEQ